MGSRFVQRMTIILLRLMYDDNNVRQLRKKIGDQRLEWRLFKGYLRYPTFLS